MSLTRPLVPLLLSLLGLWPVLAEASSPGEVYFSGLSEILKGDPVSVQVDLSGHIRPGPEKKPLTEPLGESAVSMLETPDGALWVGTAKGQLFRVDRQGRKQEILKRQSGMVHVLAARDNRVLIARQPTGQLIEVSASGKQKPVAVVKTQYIWKALWQKNHWVIATGSPGQILKIGPKGQQELLFDAKGGHLRQLAYHPKRGLIFGGGDKGSIYQLDGKNRAFALYESGLEEVSGLAIDPQTGDLYAAFLSTQVTPKPATLKSVFLALNKKQGGPQSKPRIALKTSLVLRIQPSGDVDKLWASKTEAAMALAFDTQKRELRFATSAIQKGEKARIYTVSPEDHDRVGLLTSLDAPVITALSPRKDGALVVATATEGELIQVGPHRMKRSSYLSKVEDLQRPARFGRAWFVGDMPRHSAIRLWARSGNTETPDATWSPWSGPVTVESGGPVDVPRGRFVQLKAELEQRGESPVLKSLHLSMRHSNLPPKIRQILVLAPNLELSVMPQNPQATRNVLLTAKGLEMAAQQPARSLPRQAMARPKQGSLSLGWVADDPDHDSLLAEIEIKAHGVQGATWQHLGSDLELPFLSFDSRSYADGPYLARVTVSDRADNDPSESHQDRLISEPFIIDNTPPTIHSFKVKRVKSSLVIDAVVSDAVSRLEAAKLSVNGGPWLNFPAVDGLIDGPREVLSIRVPTPKGDPKSWQFAMRVLDVRGNVQSLSQRGLSAR